MLEMFLRYGIFTLITFILIALFIKSRQNQNKTNTQMPLESPRTESWWGRIGAAIMMFGISALCMWAAKLFFTEFSSLSREGTETTITVVSLNKIEKRTHKKRPSTYDEYYTISYTFEDTQKEKTFVYDSGNEARDFADGQELPAVVQDLATASELQAPATKASLLRNAWIFSGTVGFFSILFAAGGIRILTRKPYKLIKGADGKMKWEM